ncbi:MULTISPECIES: IS3 family transposase [unclassified Rhodococcus (in: high G+C Gram-positive bacteria)]|uniref:IS3 family transposase n=1 Tax=unclassified Rhodococcus (in: high G+C Gram-positive bacteria) TaxID=192944 RepID=UPI001FFB6A18|nr:MULTISPECIES: IS3 family transposase [unclassified Rhodococcus (in: high G+C Gram-positive bacteria)]
MDSAHPRADGPRRRRAFTAAEKIEHVRAYEQACESGDGGAYLRREGLYSSLISEWRKHRDAGVLVGKKPGEKVGKLTAEQAEIARLTRELNRANKRLNTTEAALDIMGKGTRALGISLRERGFRREEQQAMTTAYTTLTGIGISSREGSVLTGLHRSTATRRSVAATAPTPPVPQEPAAEPVNKVTTSERRRILGVLNCERFVDLAPLQIYAQLLDEGIYLCSVSTMYRVLRENRQVSDRRRLARNPARACPELVATAPRQVYSWDITKLAGPVKGQYFDAYVMIDIYSRYIVGVHVHNHESGVLAKELMEQIFSIHGVPHVVHADRGTSMTSKTVATLLADLEVTRSHSRPRVSNDNPYSESLFKTLKYGPGFPDRFRSLSEARAFMDIFTDWYNHEHRHTGIGLHTPADVHYGLAARKAAERRLVLDAARAAHPHRFGSTAAPKILDLPDTAWINKPAETTDTDQEHDSIAA